MDEFVWSYIPFLIKTTPKYMHSGLAVRTLTYRQSSENTITEMNRPITKISV